MDLHVAFMDSRTPLEARYQRVRQLLDVTLLLNASRRVDDVLDTMLRSTCEIVGCGQASILLYDPHTHSLRFVAATGNALSELSALHVPLEGSLAGTIFTENRCVHVRNTQQDERHFDGVDEAINFVTNNLLGVPLAVAGKTIGVLEAINKPGDFEPEDERVLLTMASHAAVALRNARQASELQRMVQAIRRVDALKTSIFALAYQKMRPSIADLQDQTGHLQAKAAPDLQEFVDEIASGSARLEAVVGALSSMLELLDRSLKLSPVEVHTFVQVLESQLPEDLGYRVVWEPQTDQLLWIDLELVAKAVLALIDNALGFSPSDSPVHVRISPAEGGHHVEVRDYGIPIPPEERQRVLEPFYQVSSHLTRDRGGLGLGLALVREVVDRHGGKVQITAGPENVGTRVVLWLPDATPTWGLA